MRKLDALLLLSYICIVTIKVMWPFLTVPWAGLQYVIMVFPDHTHLLFVTTSVIIVTLHYPIFSFCYEDNFRKHVTKGNHNCGLNDTFRE